MPVESVSKLINGAKALISALIAMSITLIVAFAGFGLANLPMPNILVWMGSLGLLAFACTFIASLIAYSARKKA